MDEDDQIYNNSLILNTYNTKDDQSISDFVNEIINLNVDGAKGSLFWFTIPYRPDAMSAAESKPVADSSVSNIWAPSPIYSLSTVPHTRLQVDCNSPDIDLNPDAVTAPLTKTSFQILVVDDAPLIVRMTTMLLKRKGHIVEQAVNGAEALDRIVAAYVEDGTKPYDDSGTPAFDVVVMDLQMPIMDGIEAIRRVRAAEQVHVLRYESVGRQQQQVVAAGERIAFSATTAADTMRGTGQQEEQGDGCGGGGEEKDSAITTKEEEGPADSAAGGPLPPKPPNKVTETSSARAPERFAAVAATVQYKEQTEVEKEEEEEEACRNKSSLMRQRYHQFMSANSDHETVQVALAAGADAFISKPFAYDSFQQAIEHRMK